MSTKHTPGPWQSDAAGESHEWVVLSSENQSICACMNGVGGKDRVQANARLIAAAPELLEALEDVLKITMFHSNPESELERRKSKARAAIAKAKGVRK